MVGTSGTSAPIPAVQVSLLEEAGVSPDNCGHTTVMVQSLGIPAVALQRQTLVGFLRAQFIAHSALQGTAAPGRRCEPWLTGERLKNAIHL
jgi:hypothetical protein